MLYLSVIPVAMTIIVNRALRFDYLLRHTSM